MDTPNGTPAVESEDVDSRSIPSETTRIAKFQFTPTQWVVVAAVFLGIFFMGWTWSAIEPAPPKSQWPLFYPWDPETRELLFPDSGPEAKQTFVLKGWVDAKMPSLPGCRCPI